jgi:hypothetical protein
MGQCAEFPEQLASSRDASVVACMTETARATPSACKNDPLFGVSARQCDASVVVIGDAPAGVIETHPLGVARHLSATATVDVSARDRWRGCSVVS